MSPAPEKNPDLHGNVPESSPVVLLLIDVINDLEFPEGEQIEEAAERMGERIAKLAARAREAGVPVVYVNDNFGRWTSDFRQVIEHCLHDGVRGAKLAAKVLPESEDYFVLKPKHSAFYATTLDVLLSYLNARTLILTGIAANICILFSANDAYMRDYDLVVPSDTTVANTPEEKRHALDQMKGLLKAEVCESSEIDFDALKKKRATRG